MIRQTGGAAMGATSTRSRSAARAFCSASDDGHDTQLLPLGAHETHFRYLDLLVDSGFLGDDVLLYLVRVDRFTPQETFEERLDSPWRGAAPLRAVAG